MYTTDKEKRYIRQLDVLGHKIAAIIHPLYSPADITVLSTQKKRPEGIIR